MNNPPIGICIDAGRPRDGFDIEPGSITGADGGRPIETTRAASQNIFQRKIA